VGPVYLTDRLKSSLERSSSGLIINVVYSAYRFFQGNPFSDINSQSSFVGFQAYARAKLLNLLWSFSLAKRLSGTTLSVAAVNPGGAWTPNIMAMTKEAVPAWKYIWPLARLYQRLSSVTKAARVVHSVAELVSKNSMNGYYFDEKLKPFTAKQIAFSPEMFEKIEQLIGEKITSNDYPLAT
jgi:retinol dehydrogenase-12